MVPVCSTIDCKASVVPSSKAPLAVLLPRFAGTPNLDMLFSLAMFCAPREPKKELIAVVGAIAIQSSKVGCSLP